MEPDYNVENAIYMHLNIIQSIKTVVESTRESYLGELLFSNKYAKVIEMSQKYLLSWVVHLGWMV